MNGGYDPYNSLTTKGRWMPDPWVNEPVKADRQRNGAGLAPIVSGKVRTSQRGSYHASKRTSR